MKKHTATLIGIASFALAGSAQAGIVQVTARFDPPIQTVTLGDVFTVDIVADIVDPIVGWGLDLSFSAPGILSIDGPPTIPSPPWKATTGADADGLVALADPLAPVFGSVSGLDVVLATMSFSADLIGQTDLLLSATPGDLTEGFPLTTPGEFATVLFELGDVTVVPEPASLSMLVILTLPLLRSKRRR